MKTLLITIINVYFKFLPLRIGKFFSCKDSTPKFLQSYVIYQFSCSGCDACYIKQTKRHLRIRIEKSLKEVNKIRT